MLPLGLEPRLFESKPNVITTYTKRAPDFIPQSKHTICVWNKTTLQARLELATFRLEVECAIQLRHWSYTRFNTEELGSAR